MKIQHVPINYVNQTWPYVAPFIVEGIAHAKGDYTLEHIQTYVITGQWVLVVAVDDAGVIHGGMTINFYNRPSDRVAFVTSTGGKLIINQETFEQLKQLVSSFGATCIEAAARESMVRLLTQCGFKEKYKVVEVKL